MRVADIMIPDPLRVAPDATVNEMMDLMDRHSFRHLPIVDDGRLVGIVSQRDLLSATGWLPTPSESDLRARDVLHAGVVTVGPDDSVVTLALELELRSIGCMPVVDGDDLVGIVTETDVLSATVRNVREDPRVTEVMSAAPRSVAPGTPMAEAERIARESEVRHLPVVDGERLVGMLSDRDLRRWRGRNQKPDLPVERIMTPVPLVVDAQARVSEAADHLVTHKVGALPVVSGERVIGIVSVADVLEHCENHLREADTLP